MCVVNLTTTSSDKRRARSVYTGAKLKIPLHDKMTVTMNSTSHECVASLFFAFLSGLGSLVDIQLATGQPFESPKWSVPAFHDIGKLAALHDKITALLRYCSVYTALNDLGRIAFRSQFE